MSWNPKTWTSLSNVPIVGDVWKGLTGDPSAIKAAYDTQIQASKDAQARMQAFLMGQQGKAQAIYGPLQHMFQNAYGTEGMQGPQIPTASGSMGPIQSMYRGAR